jgi:hypothetical protein
MSFAKVYPEEVFFVVPGKPPMPKWKQLELAKDPNFKDFREQLEGGPKETWSSKHGYALTIRQEAAILKANTRNLKRESSNQKIIKESERYTEVNSCCIIT